MESCLVSFNDDGVAVITCYIPVFVCVLFSWLCSKWLIPSVVSSRPMTTMASSSSSIVPSEEQLMKLDRLSTIADHIQDISRKIADLANDPLPGQMEQSMPGYNSILALHSEMLKRRRWTFVIAGKTSHYHKDRLRIAIEANWVDDLLKLLWPLWEFQTVTGNGFSLVLNT